MGKKCIVPGCKSGYDSNKKRVSLFKVPTNCELRAKWTSVIPPTKIKISTSHVVCEEHFVPSDIKRNFVKHDADGTVIAYVPLQSPRLSGTAIPSIFPGYETVDPSIESSVAVSATSGCDTIKETVVNRNTVDSSSHDDLKTSENATDKVSSHSNHAKTQYTSDILTDHAEFESIEHMDDVAIELSNDDVNVTDSSFQQVFETLYEDASSVVIPEGWVRLTSPQAKKWVAFSTFGTKMEPTFLHLLPRRSVLLTIEGDVHVSVNGKEVPCKSVCDSIERIQTLDEISRLLRNFAKTNVCSGLEMVKASSTEYRTLCQDSFGQWRHQSCSIATESRICASCQKLRKSIAQSKRRQRKRNLSCNFNSRSKVASLNKQVRSQKEVIRRAKKRTTKLKDEISVAQDLLRNSNEQTIVEKCKGLPNISEAQVMCIREIVEAASRKSPAGNRYGDDWMMLCLLMHIRSPSHYRFLMKNKVICLPSSRTIRRYMSVVNTQCGFDPNFFELFKRRLEAKKPRERHGILLLDEISVREAISVCSSTLTYKGLTDFGGERTATNDINDKATHGLVLMFKAIADKYAQPIAVFASKGPVRGAELAKIVLKAIMLLEKSKALVHAIVSDGAQTNRKMWTELGVSGKKGRCQSSFTHPCDETRRVFMFSDTPHLIKNIRNNLYNEGELQLQPDGAPVKWSHFRVLHAVDSRLPANLRVCHKITENHLTLNTSTKMRVRLATQIFSESVANGLEFYRRNEKIKELQDSEPTIEFCKSINKMFDALNRKLPWKGVKPGGEDIEVLKGSLHWLDEWESLVERGSIEKAKFLSTNTAEGLRVTLQSAIDLCNYLCTRFDFQYLLTGKINQDSLEQFFGTIRQAAGSNDHPGAPTFLQLYKLLSTYSILKPPVSGNCTILDQKKPQFLFKIEDLKNIYKPEKKHQVQEIQEKLNSLIEQDDWEADEIFEHDYSLAPVLDCVIYFVTGYLCKQLQKYAKCNVCRDAITSSNSYSQHPAAQLVNIKTHGRLIHPNQIFFQLILAVEKCFINNCNRADVYDRTVDDMLMTYKFSFPCTEHGQNFLAYAIHYYLRLRMRQLSAQHTTAQRKKSMEKRKQAKFYKN